MAPVKALEGNPFASVKSIRVRDLRLPTLRALAQDDQRREIDGTVRRQQVEDVVRERLGGIERHHFEVGVIAHGAGCSHVEVVLPPSVSAIARDYPVTVAEEGSSGECACEDGTQPVPAFHGFHPVLRLTTVSHKVALLKHFAKVRQEA